VAVVDFDVHHGNGTQDICWDRPGVLYVSSHQSPLYPGTGKAAETGGHENVLNMPLAGGSGSESMREVYTNWAFPKLREFRPQLLLISAGFDAHRLDPLAGLQWTEDDYAWVTAELVDIAAEHCGGRVVSSLEGGYHLEALARSVAVHLVRLGSP
jgi:acetoin utilization deacetylase AcuC-like enzyme